MPSKYDPSCPLDSRTTDTASQREAQLPTPDPAMDSATAHMTSGHGPYMVATYVRAPPVMVQGEGSQLFDMENRRYLDFTAGIAVNSLGHADPEISKILYQQVCAVS